MATIVASAIAVRKKLKSIRPLLLQHEFKTKKPKITCFKLFLSLSLPWGRARANPLQTEEGRSRMRGQSKQLSSSFLSLSSRYTLEKNYSHVSPRPPRFAIWAFDEPYLKRACTMGAYSRPPRLFARGLSIFAAGRARNTRPDSREARDRDDDVWRCWLVWASLMYLGDRYLRDSMSVFDLG